ncbi:hypothetical protein ACSVIJ_03985 [Pseudomonas sp. NCHU5208]|uniref:hypothetical protein n=1 Tax=unclassified Pseudomonas TaxID=196821 RepID=UPI003F97A19A
MRTLVAREPWRADRRPDVPVDESLEEWGWLEIYMADGKPEFVFIHERPSDDEIKQRKSCR